MNTNRSRPHHRRRSGFTLIEVTLAIGLCAGSLLVIFSLLPVGMDTIQSASSQVTEAEIFNRLWSQFSSTPFYELQNAKSGTNPVFASAGSAVYFYYDADGQDITPSGANASAPAGAVYIVRATLANSQTNTTLNATVPAVDGGADTSGASLTFLRIEIGHHFDPGTLAAGKTDARVATKNFLLAKRDTWSGS